MHKDSHIRISFLLAQLCLVIGLGAPVTASTSGTGVPLAMSPLEPATSGGLETIDRALVRLTHHRRLLMIAAHPDDEDTAVLTWVARQGGEAAYLSLSRGDGGQNLIGPELGVGLGLLRSRELQAARRIDGARQYFSRAYDFGYTRSLDETLRRWPKDVLLDDTMRVVRRFKPQVLVAIFPPTAAAGHGQHQASGLVADEIFELSRDSAAFPDLTEEGLSPWPISSFFRAAWWNPDAASLRLPLGTIEPFSGRSILQIALESRSQHRCQDMGSLQPLGDAEGRLIRLAGTAGESEDDLFAGVDTRLQAMADTLPEGELRRDTASRLARVSEIAAEARRQLRAGDPQVVSEPLLEIVRVLSELVGQLTPIAEAATARSLIEEKLTIAQEGLLSAARIALDATSQQDAIVPGASFEVRSMLWNAGRLPVTDLDIEVVAPSGWRTLGSELAEPRRSRFATRLTDEQRLTIEVPSDAAPSVPYFLRSPRLGDLYDWDGAPRQVWGDPFESPPLSLRFEFALAGVPIRVEREVVQRYRDQAVGEVRRPLRVVPRFELSVEPSLVVWPSTSKSTQLLTVEIVSNVSEPTRGTLRVSVPEGWASIEPLQVELEPPASQRQRLAVTLEAPAELATGQHEVKVDFIDDTGRRFERALRVVDYSHVRPSTLPVTAEVSVSAADIRLPQLQRVGYIRGASDRVPEMLQRLDLPLELLSASDLVEQDLAGFDAIVVGSRAYEVDLDLARYNDRLLDYARDGGLLIVQYQQYQFVRQGLAPFPLDIHRPHDRVTDETAPVRVLEPSHAVFRTPNQIGEEDWRGWVQERGLYFARTWDDAYEPLLAMADPGGEEKQGSLLVAGLGKGHYVYTGLAFFRQLPAGVTGAYRLFANLLALGKSDPNPSDPNPSDSENAASRSSQSGR